MDKRGGLSRFSVENLLCHSAEKFRRGILYCCIYFGHRKGLDERGGEFHDSPSKIFCLTVSKIFVGESFTVALISGIEKVWIRRRAVSRFSIENFCLTVPKNSVGESFTVALISGSEKVYGQQGGEKCQDFQAKILCLTVPKIFVEESFTVAAISGTGNIGIRKGGVSSFSVEIFLSHSAEKFRRGIFHCFIIFGYRKSLDNEWGVSRFSVEIFLSHSAEKFRRGVLYCCSSFR